MYVRLTRECARQTDEAPDGRAGLDIRLARAGRRRSKSVGKQASRQAGKQASRQAGKQSLCKNALYQCSDERSAESVIGYSERYFEWAVT